MGAVGSSFSSEIFRKDFPIIIATNRHTAVMLPVRLAYHADGYVAGQLLAQNSTSKRYVKYNLSGSSGEDTAKAVLFESKPVEDFDSTAATGSTMAVAIFGGCVLYKDKLVDYDADALTDLKARLIEDASGTSLFAF